MIGILLLELGILLLPKIVRQVLVEKGLLLPHILAELQHIHHLIGMVRPVSLAVLIRTGVDLVHAEPHPPVIKSVGNLHAVDPFGHALAAEGGLDIPGDILRGDVLLVEDEHTLPVVRIERIDRLLGDVDMSGCARLVLHVGRDLDLDVLHALDRNRIDVMRIAIHAVIILAGTDIPQMNVVDHIRIERLSRGTHTHIDIHGHLPLDNQIGCRFRGIFPQSVRRIVGTGRILVPPVTQVVFFIYGLLALGTVLIHVERKTMLRAILYLNGLSTAVDIGESLQCLALESHVITVEKACIGIMILRSGISLEKITAARKIYHLPRFGRETFDALHGLAVRRRD